MNANVIYWTAALINMGVLAGFALAGVRQIRRGEAERHRRSMWIAASLVIGFVVSYAGKLALLGREDLSVWSDAARYTLRFHELCVLCMVVGGVSALRLGARLRGSSLASDDPDALPPDPAEHAWHRRAGKLALGGALLGFVSAGFVLAGMYGRL